MIVIRHLEMTGRVQGVGFRAAFAMTARRIGLKGWVRNRRDGAVEAVIAGSEEAVDELIEWARSGPGLAEVRGMRVSEFAGEFDRFEIKESI